MHYGHVKNVYCGIRHYSVAVGSRSALALLPLKRDVTGHTDSTKKTFHRWPHNTQLTSFVGVIMHFCQNSIVMALRVVKHVRRGTAYIASPPQRPASHPSRPATTLRDLGHHLWGQKSNSTTPKHSTHFVRWCNNTVIPTR